MKDSQSIGRFQWKILFYAKLKLILSILSALFIPLFFSAASVHKALWNIDTFMALLRTSPNTPNWKSCHQN